MEQDHVAKQKRYAAQPTQRTARSGGSGRPRWARGRGLLVLLAVIALGMAVILQAAARERSGPPLPLRTIADIPLAGGSSRMDYESLDQRAGLLFIAHLGAGMVSVLDMRSNRIVTT